MTSLLDLPPELLVDILSWLEKSDRKEFRCTSRLCAQLTDPTLFGEVIFDLNPGGCDSIEQIAKSPTLCAQVHTVRLHLRSGLKEFLSFDDWRDANILEHDDPWADEVRDEPILDESRGISGVEWKALGEAGQKRLYDEYQVEVKAQEAYISRLASAIFRQLSLGDKQRTPVDNNASDADRTLQKLILAMNALTKVRNFVHIPAYEIYDDSWGRTWRNIEFSVAGLVANSSFGNDPDYDALQLFAAFYAIILAPNALCAANIFTRGPAFWSSPHLRRLLDWSDRFILRNHPTWDTVEEGLDAWTDEVGGPLAAMRYTETLTRGLVQVERGFSRLTCLECRVETSWSNDHEELAKALSKGLKEAAKLEELDLIFRENAGSDDGGEYIYFDYSRQPKVYDGPLRDMFNKYVKASSSLLLDSAPGLRRLRRAHLSLATGVPHLLSFLSPLANLRDLCLEHVTLLPNGGHWETALQWISEHLQLEHIELQDLEDIFNFQPRLILCPEAPAWKATSRSDEHYHQYKDAILRYALGQTKSTPLLLAENFLQQHSCGVNATAGMADSSCSDL